MSNQRVEVPKDAFVRMTGQLWKLIVGGFFLPWPAVAIGLFTFRRIGPDQPTSEFVTGIAAMVAIAALMAFLLASIRCPRCCTRLAWDAFPSSGRPERAGGFAESAQLPQVRLHATRRR